jgi:glycosyltransferase involved in cell wall biosynthesis
VKSIKPILEISTMTVQPSVYEPLGMAQIEGLYMGVPVIASRVGGIPETITHEETGILVEPNNIAELASAVLNTLGNLDLANQRSQKGREFVINRFSLASNISRLQELIEEDH